MQEESILMIRDYGKIQLHLRELMDAKQITRYKLARQINSRFEVIDKWYRGEIEKLDLDVLARICYVMKCEVGDIVGDIVEYTE